MMFSGCVYFDAVSVTEFTKEQRQQPEEPQENSCCIKEVNGIGNLVLSKGKIFLVKKCSVHYDQG